MTLYFQYLTQNQTVEVGKMLYLAKILAGCTELSGHVKVYAQGKISRSSFAGIAQLSKRIEKRRFNELELLPDKPGRFLGRRVAHIKSYVCTLAPSVTCALWFSTRDWRNDGDRASDNRYMSAQSREKAIEFHQVGKVPTVFEALLEITTKKSQESVLDECAEWLAKTLTETFDPLRLFGCCDVVRPVFLPQLGGAVLMPQRFQVMMNVAPPSYSELGSRFEALHPLMFGSERVCRGISDSLGAEASITVAGAAKDFAIIRLAPTLDQSTANARAKKWLIRGADKLT